jgi:apolipoprotein D and lipocalin family protein
MRALPLALSLFALAGCATAKVADSPLRPTTTIDAGRFYTGTWYEIGRRPIKLTDGCVAGGTTYTPQGGDRVRVLDFCHDGSPTGKLKTIGGPARISDPGSNARLHVSYRFLGVIPVQRDYWVLARADDYSWFISANPSFRDLWIYTRKPNPTQAELAPLVARAKALGYDTGQLEFPATGTGETAAQ